MVHLTTGVSLVVDSLWLELWWLVVLGKKFGGRLSLASSVMAGRQAVSGWKCEMPPTGLDGQ